VGPPGEATRVLEPAYSVVRLDEVVVEHVAVGDESVEVAVAIEIHEGEPRRSPGRMGGGVDRLPAKYPGAVVEEGDDRLVLLREEGHEVGKAVSVEVGHGDVYGPGPDVHDPAGERRVGPVGGPGLEQVDRPHPAPPEGGHDEVEIAVAVEIRRLHVGHAWQAVGQGDGEKGAVGPVPEPDHAAPEVVTGGNASQVGHEEGGASVAVEVDPRAVAGVPCAAERIEALVAPFARHDSGVHVRGHDAETSALADREEGHIGGQDLRGHALRPEGMLREAVPSLVDGGPRLRRSQRRWGPGLVVADHPFGGVADVRGRPVQGRPHPLHREPLHLVDHGAPRLTREAVGGREGVAGAAESPDASLPERSGALRGGLRHGCPAPARRRDLQQQDPEREPGDDGLRP
jgi:hypothetical protein